MLLTTETTIRGIRIMSTQLRPVRSYSLMPKLLKIVGPALAPLVTGDVDLGKDIEVLFPVLLEALDRLDSEDTEELLGRILESTTVIRADAKGELTKYDLTNDHQINMAFAGDVPALLEGMWFVLKANYESFFGEDLLKTFAASQAEAEPVNPSS